MTGTPLTTRGTKLIWIFVLVGVAQSEPAHAEWTIAAYLGAAHTLATDVSISQPARQTDLILQGVTFRGRSLESPVYYGYRIGRDLPFLRAISVEAEVTHAKAYARAEQVILTRGRRNGLEVNELEPMAKTVEALSMSHGLNLILVNVAAQLPIRSPDGRWRLTLRLGAGPTLPHAESTIDGRHQEQYQWGGIGTQAAAGAEIRVVKGLAGLIEYRFTRARETLSIADGVAQLETRTHHVIFGAIYRI